MRINQSRLKYLIHRYADNSCTKDEMAELFSFVSDPRHDDEFTSEFMVIWNSIHPGELLSEADKNELFRKIQYSIPEAPVRKMWFTWTKAAAVVLILISAGVLYFVLPTSTGVDKTPETASSLISGADHKLIRLPDGSSVLLNNNSKLEFPKDFTTNHREVVLIGEAYFDIARDPEHPFVITSGSVKTMVLGTAFNIRAYPHEEHVTVTVTRGKVKVESDDKVLGILSPNEQLSYNKEKSAITKNEVVADSAITWKEKDLVFDNVSFAQAAEEISKRYGVQIVFDNDNVRNCRFYASFLHEDKLEQVLTVLCDLNNAKYAVNNKVVTISGEGCN